MDNTTKIITAQDVDSLRKNLQAEIVALLREHHLTELSLGKEGTLSGPTFIIDYCERSACWNELQVIAVGICEDGDLFLRVANDIEDVVMTIYASGMSIATHNIDWLLGIRDNIRETLELPVIA